MDSTVREMGVKRTLQPATNNLAPERSVPLRDLPIHQRDLARQLGLDHAQGAGPTGAEGTGVLATADGERHSRAEAATGLGGRRAAGGGRGGGSSGGGAAGGGTGGGAVDRRHGVEGPVRSVNMCFLFFFS